MNVSEDRASSKTDVSERDTVGVDEAAQWCLGQPHHTRVGSFLPWLNGYGVSVVPRSAGCCGEWKAGGSSDLMELLLGSAGLCRPWEGVLSAENVKTVRWIEYQSVFYYHVPTILNQVSDKTLLPENQVTGLTRGLMIYLYASNQCIWITCTLEDNIAHKEVNSEHSQLYIQPLTHTKSDTATRVSFEN